MLGIYGFWKRNVRATKENPDVLHLHGNRLVRRQPHLNSFSLAFLLQFIDSEFSHYWLIFRRKYCSCLAFDFPSEILFLSLFFQQVFLRNWRPSSSAGVLPQSSTQSWSNSRAENKAEGSSISPCRYSPALQQL